MSHPTRVTLSIASEHAMTRLGEALAERLKPGDTILLRGPIGAGKSHLARAAIHQRIGPDEDVPSPTFTLVQTYEADGIEIWHADLYRLSDSSELVELGLDEAIGTAIVLIEWPDRMPEDLVPDDALWLSIDPEGEARCVVIESDSQRWADVLAGLPNV